MWWRALLAGGFLAGLLGACAVVDPVDSRYDTVSRSLAKARDESIFLNIIRASHDYPLAFTTIANVTPTMTNTSSFALPTFLLGAGPAPLRPQSAEPWTVERIHFGLNHFGVSRRDFRANNGFELNRGEHQFQRVDARKPAISIRASSNRSICKFSIISSARDIRANCCSGCSPIPSNSSVGPSVGPLALGYYYNPPDTYGCPKDKLAQVQQICFRDWVWAALLAGTDC